MVMGEITTNAYVDIQKIVRETVREIGYTRGKYGFDADNCAVLTAIDEQSTDIAMGVNKALERIYSDNQIPLSFDYSLRLAPSISGVAVTS